MVSMVSMGMLNFWCLVDLKLGRNGATNFGAPSHGQCIGDIQRTREVWPRIFAVDGRGSVILLVIRVVTISTRFADEEALRLIAEESILIRLFCQISPPGPQHEWIQYKTQVSIWRVLNEEKGSMKKSWQPLVVATKSNARPTNDHGAVPHGHHA